ncbi:MAG: 6-phosphofructokinase [Bacilli bacterium]|jgi:6-phosphofructokinase 1
MRKIGILTSGGDAPGMNAAVRALTRMALQEGFEVYGVYDGYKGLVEDDIHPLTRADVAGIIYRGGTVLRTVRLEEFQELEIQKKGIKNLKKHGIDTLIVIGGDGTFRGAECLSNLGLNCLCIPGTIDNDLAYTDFTLGFDTAVNTVLSAINNIRDTMTSHGRVCIVEVMGKRCGDIALYAAIAGGAEEVLIPEREYDIARITERLRKDEASGKKSDIIILSEGVFKAVDLAKEIQASLRLPLRTITLGHVQRGGTPSMMDRLLAARFSYHAIELIKSGVKNRAIGIKDNKIIDLDITEALALKKELNQELCKIEELLR